MVVRIATVAFEGIEARPVDVQVQLAPGNVVFNVVGLGDKAVTESRERVRSALIASGLALNLLDLRLPAVVDQLAAMLGLPYAFASHFAPDALDQALAIYFWIGGVQEQLLDALMSLDEDV